MAQLTLYQNTLTILSACGGFLSSRKSVARVTAFFAQTPPPPPHKKMHPRRSPYRLVIDEEFNPNLEYYV
jgi:hypothetical protein